MHGVRRPVGVPCDQREPAQLLADRSPAANDRLVVAERRALEAAQRADKGRRDDAHLWWHTRAQRATISVVHSARAECRARIVCTVRLALTRTRSSASLAADAPASTHSTCSRARMAHSGLSGALCTECPADWARRSVWGCVVTGLCTAHTLSSSVCVADCDCASRPHCGLRKWWRWMASKT